MTDTLNITLFECENVSVFCIPPGEILLSKWNIDESNVLWRGKLRLVEQEFNGWDEEEELTEFETWGKDDFEKLYLGLRLKLELYNDQDKGENIWGDGTKEQIWAEVYYNPRGECSKKENIAKDGKGSYYIAKNLQETIEMTPQSSKFYRIIVQLPGSGYHPFRENKEGKERSGIIQIALGLRLGNSSEASMFSESLFFYKKRFLELEEQLRINALIPEFEAMQGKLSLEDDRNKDHTGTRRYELEFLSAPDAGTESPLNTPSELYGESDDEEGSEFGEFVC